MFLISNNSKSEIVFFAYKYDDIFRSDSASDIVIKSADFYLKRNLCSEF